MRGPGPCCRATSAAFPIVSFPVSFCVLCDRVHPFLLQLQLLAALARRQLFVAIFLHPWLCACVSVHALLCPRLTGAEPFRLCSSCQSLCDCVLYVSLCFSSVCVRGLGLATERIYLAFKTYDTSEDGLLQFNELFAALTSFGMEVVEEEVPPSLSSSCSCAPRF